MNTIKLYLFLALSLIIIYPSFSQTEMSVFTATGRGGVATTFVDDYQSIGINPSNLGWSPELEGKKIAFSILEGGGSLFTQALTRRDLLKSLAGFGSTTFTRQEKMDAAVSFTSKDFAANLDLSLFAFSLKTEKAGGFAFSIRDRVNWFSNFNQTASEIMFLGKLAPYFETLQLTDGSTIANTPANTNGIPDADIAFGFTNSPTKFSAIFEGSKIAFSWMREFNVSYGITLIKNETYDISFGAGAKYLQGIATMKLSATNGVLEAQTAISPGFGIDYGVAASTNPSALPSSSSFPPKGVGAGVGFDVGISAVMNEKLKIGFAINDIGSITWTGNVYQGADNDLANLASGGFDSFNFFSQAQNITGANGVMQWSGEKESTDKLPTVARFGTSYLISEKIEVGADMVLPLNDAPSNFERPMIGLGGDFKVAPMLTLSSGFNTGGNYGFNIPMGVTVGIAKNVWEVGIATRDVITYFTKDRPMVSASFGFLRFRL